MNMEQHNQAVAELAVKVRKFYDEGKPFRMSHGSTNSTRDHVFERDGIIDTSVFKHVLKVDTVKRTALVEPNVPMDRLVETTMKYGLIPPVVMEFPGITAGGGYAGTSGESSSFKYGFFDRTINYVEMVLANGKVVQASEHERADLFHGAAGAVGSLGVTTLMEIQLKQAKPFVEVTYHPVLSVHEAVGRITQLALDMEIDYLDGILYSLNRGALITGKLVDTIPQDMPVQRFTRAWDPWFYLHVEEKIYRNSRCLKEAVPLYDYLFRYDRGGFWVGRNAFDYFLTPFNRTTRWFLDDFLHTRMMYRALHSSEQGKRCIIQDLALPLSTAEDFINYANDKFGIYPLWLCPLKQSPMPTIHPHSSRDEGSESDKPPHLLNIGLWGFGPSSREEFVSLNRDLESKVRELGGMKWLYAHTYYTEQEFWEVYDRKWYEALREKYDATSLPSVYDKVKVDVEAERRAEARVPGWWRWLVYRWPLEGIYGVFKAVQSRDFLLNRHSVWRVVGAKEGAEVE